MEKTTGLDPVIELGHVVVTRTVAEVMSRWPPFQRLVYECLGRHRQGDWGDLDEHDQGVNDAAVIEGNRILSSYPLPAGMEAVGPNDRLWVITEWNRSSTTVLFPSDY